MLKSNANTARHTGGVFLLFPTDWTVNTRGFYQAADELHVSRLCFLIAEHE